MIEKMLDELAELQAQQAAIDLDKQALIDHVITPEIKAKIDEIEAEFADKTGTVYEKITSLTANIKQAVIERGETVKGSNLMAVWSKGRTSWDTKKLEGLMMVIPAVAEARKEGEPSVSIRKA